MSRLGGSSGPDGTGDSCKRCQLGDHGTGTTCTKTRLPPHKPPCSCFRFELAGPCPRNSADRRTGLPCHLPRRFWESGSFCLTCRLLYLKPNLNQIKCEFIGFKNFNDLRLNFLRKMFCVFRLYIIFDL